MLGIVDGMSVRDDRLMYRAPWQWPDAQRFFARQPVPPSVSLLRERTDDVLRWREVRFAVGAGVEGIATLVVPTAVPVARGVVVAHGGTDDGRRFFLSEAAALAAQGAAVVLPATRMRGGDGIDTFASDVRTAVLTQRAALDLLVEAGSPPDALSFLGHSAGGSLGAVLSAVEPRLTRIAIFGSGAGPWSRSAMAQHLLRGGDVTEELLAVVDWFDVGRFVGVDHRALLLVQHGRTDETVPVEAGRALFEAAAEPKRWAECECGHDLDADPGAKKVRAAFVLDSSTSP